MKNYICDLCGAHLDPGEHCTCEEEKEENIKRLMGFFFMQEDGQFSFNIGGKEISE